MVENKLATNGRRIIINAVFILVSICCVVPILYILSASLTSEDSLIRNGYTLIPREFSLDAYKYVLESPGQLLKSYGVTIFVTVVGTSLSVILTSMLGYSISRQNFKWHRKIAFYVFLPMLISGGAVASYITITRFYHLRNSIFVLILPVIISPWYVLLMKGFYADVPQSLVDAAKIDGCSEWKAFLKIVLPISKPAIATVALMTAFSYWNEWWLSMMYMDGEYISLQYYLYRIMNNVQFLLSTAIKYVAIDVSSIPSETMRMAICVLAVGPMLIVFPFFQKYFVKGISVGSVKG